MLSWLLSFSSSWTLCSKIVVLPAANAHEQNLKVLVKGKQLTAGPALVSDTPSLLTANCKCMVMATGKRDVAEVTAKVVASARAVAVAGARRRLAHVFAAEAVLAVEHAAGEDAAHAARVMS